MASSELRKPNYSRRFLWFAIFIFVLFGGYSAGWLYVAGLAQQRVDETIASLNNGGQRVVCDSAQVGGFPFRIGLTCGDVSYERAGDLALHANAFRAAAQVYQPSFVVTELDSPARIESPLVGALDLNWRNLRSSVRIAQPLPERLSIEATDLAISARSDAPTQPLIKAEIAAAHMRPNGPDVDYAGSFTKLTLDSSLLAGGALPPLSGEGDLTVTDGVELLRGGAEGLRGRSIQIRSASLAAGDAAIALSGPVSIDGDGLIDATLTVRATNPAALAGIAAAALPEQADQIRSTMTGLAMLGPNASLPLAIRKGKATLGFIPLGTIPPLR